MISVGRQKIWSLGEEEDDVVVIVKIVNRGKMDMHNYSSS
jgi:hypothetical protein